MSIKWCRLFLFSLFMLCCTSLATAQLQTFHNLREGEGYRIRAAMDNGFYVAGVAVDDSGKGAYWLLKFDSKAKLEWSKLFGYEHSVVQLWSLTVANNNDAIIAGYAGRNDDPKLTLPLMYRVTDKGDVAKEFIIDYTLDDHFHWFQPSPDGGFYFAGHTDSKGDPRGDVWAGHLDKDYKMIWEKVFNNNFDHAHAGTVMQTNGMALVGHTQDGNFTKSWILRVDTVGKLLWSVIPHLGEPTFEEPYDIARTNEGGVCIFGTRDEIVNNTSSMMVIATDAKGKIILDSSYLPGTTFGWSGMQTSDGGYVMAGYHAISGIQFPVILKLKSNGDVEWQSNIKEDFYGVAYGVVEADGQFLATGENDLGDLWVAVLDKSGKQTELQLTVKTALNIASPQTIVAYPNPSKSGVINISLPKSGSYSSARVYDALGRVVSELHNLSATNLQWNGRDQNGTQLPNGEYYLQVTSNRGVTTTKLILAR